MSIRLSSSNNETHFLTYHVYRYVFLMFFIVFIYFSQKRKKEKKRFKITGSFVKIFCTITRQTSIPIHSLQISANLSLSRCWRHRVAFAQRQTSHCPCDASQCPNAAHSEVASRGNPSACSASGLPSLLFNIVLVSRLLLLSCCDTVLVEVCAWSEHKGLVGMHSICVWLPAIRVLFMRDTRRTLLSPFSQLY